MHTEEIIRWSRKPTISNTYILNESYNTKYIDETFAFPKLKKNYDLLCDVNL